jgi:5-methylcytosine-specific restriction endonuclease McrA
LPLYEMPRNLSQSAKAAFLKKRIADAEKHKNNALAFTKKNSDLANQKTQLRNQLLQQQKLTGIAQPSAEEQKLNADLKAYSARIEWAMQCHQWIEADQKALKRQKPKGNLTDAQLIKYAKDLGFAVEPQGRKRSAKKKVATPRTVKQRVKAVQPDDYEILKAKAAALDGKNRRNQAELKQNLKPELAKYKRCAYCESSLKFQDSHIDHITPVSKGGLGTLSNTVLVCSRCNLAKKAKTLRRFCVDARLDYERIIARLEMVGKEV